MTVEQLKKLVTAVQRLSLARDIDTIVDIVRKAARELTGADGATFVLRDHDLCYYAEEDAIAPLWKGQRFPMKACISGWSMLNRSVAIIPDIYVDERIPIEAYRPTFVKSLVMVPIRTLEPIGAIGNYWARKYTPTAVEVELLQALADITSVSVENVYAYNELRLQNEKLYDIAFLQSHQVRVPVAQIQGLFNLFDFENLNTPQNVEILRKLKTCSVTLDNVIREIVDKTSGIMPKESTGS